VNVDPQTASGAGETSAHVDRPMVGDGPVAMEWGSDALAEVLRSLEVPFVALNPGASYRGLHDSIVNYLGNERPTMLVCLHEEHAVAIAHGYAKVTGEPIAVALHSNVGLMHATMAIYNAFCDRTPVLLIGAQGPLDAEQRRPWIDWIHTVADPAALIRSYIKWDDEPGSVQAAMRSLAHASQVARTYPCAPTFVSLDATLQEDRLAGPVRPPDVARIRAPQPASPSPEQISEAMAMLTASHRTVVLMGRVDVGTQAWDARVELVRALGAQVITDLKLRSSFPTNDPHHLSVPGAQPTESSLAILRAATLVLSLDWVDLAGTLKIAFRDAGDVPLIHCTMDHVLHNGWGKNGFEVPEVDLLIEAHPDKLVGGLLSAGIKAQAPAEHWPVEARTSTPMEDSEAVTVRGLASTLRRVVAGEKVSLIRLPLAWDGADLDLTGPLDYLGQDGGAGIGSGPGMAVGAALALIGTGRLPVAVFGDGDFLMGSSALWTAARHRIPLLVLVANNRSYYNDEMHQERMARQRKRPVANRWIGQHIRDPEPDLAAMARSLGLIGHGPLTSPADLEGVLAESVSAVKEGAAVVVDVHVEVADYQVTPVIPGRGEGTGQTSGRGV